MSELDAERTVTRSEAAKYLREFADKLEGGAAGGDVGARGAGAETTGTAEQRDAATQGATEETTRQGTGAGETTRSDTPSATHESSTGTADASRTGDAAGPADAEAGAGGVPSRGKVTFLVGNDSATVNPPEKLTLGVEVGEDSSMMTSGAEQVTFSLHWDKEAVPESDELRIE